VVRLERFLLRRWAVAALAAAACLLVMLLAWLGWVAVRQWQQSLVLLADRQADDASERFLVEVTQDMQAVQRLVLLSPALDAFTSRDPAPDPTYGAVNLVASAFARYSYPEAFFLWNRQRADAGPVFFYRRDRPVRWNPAPDPAPFPVIVDERASVGPPVLQRIQDGAADGRRFVVFEMEIDGAPYQVVARLLYGDLFRQNVETIFGFVVNLDWARQRYFLARLDEVSSGNRAGEGVAISIADDRGEPVAGTRPAAVAAGAPTSERTFPLMFFNPVIAAADPPSKLRRRTWTIRAATRGDSSLLAASGDANQMLALGLVAAATLGAGIALSLRAARARLRLAELRADFVASVTHEFKTPIATIRAAGDTLAADRLDDAAARQDYARYIVHESRRLTRLVDNLLAFTRVTDTPEVRPPLEPVVLGDVIAESLERFGVQLSGGGFRVDVSVPPDLASVLGDRTGLALMLDNLIDNVIRHSRGERALAITASDSGRLVLLEVADRGGGIPADEVRHVTKKFYRGRQAGHGGTGLGLAIAARIVADHGGTLKIDSQAGVGTTMRIALPMASVQPIPSAQTRAAVEGPS
jgi:signal transduction histidine kinase